MAIKMRGIIRIGFVTILSTISLIVCGQSLDNYNVIENWLKYSNAQNSLYNFLLEQSVDLLNDRKSEVQKISTLSDWQNRQKQIKREFFNVIGPFPDKTPLNSKVVNTIEKDFYTVENIIFESQPKFYVTSSLFIPKSYKKGDRFPTIIYTSGHTDMAYRAPGYQQTILNLVRKNFIVFAFDPIGQGERLQYYDEKTGNSKLGRPGTAEHTYLTPQTFITGSSSARYWIWDGIRSVDYLLTREEIDPQRIGITGRSGGGFQSAYIPVFENRIYATAPENHLTSFIQRMESFGPLDGEQNIMGMFKLGIDHPDFLITRAPKPSLMICTTNDFFNIHGSRQTAQEISSVYKAYNKKENFDMIEDYAGHESTIKNRERMYAFFQKFLDNPGNNRDKEFEILSEKELRVSPTGQVLSSFEDCETVFSLNKKDATQIISEIDNTKKGNAEIIAIAKKISGYKEPTTVNLPVFTGQIKREGYMINKYFLKGEGDYPIPYLLMEPENSNGVLILYIHPEGKSAQANIGGEMEWFVKQGFPVLSPDLIGIGEIGKKKKILKWQEGKIGEVKNKYRDWYAAMLIGRSIVGIRAGDVNNIIKAIRKSALNIHEVYGVAKGMMTPVLQHAAAFNPEIERIVLVEPLISYQSLVENQYYCPEFIENSVPMSLGNYDLLDLSSIMDHRRQLMINPIDGTGQRLPQQEISEINITLDNNNLDIRTGAFSKDLYQFILK